MIPHLPHRFVFVLLSLLWSFETVVAQSDTASSKFAEEARALSAEGSFTLAIEKFQAAINAATDDADILQLRIDLVPAQVEGFSNIRGWQQRKRQNTAISNSLNELRDSFPPGETLLPSELRVIELQIELHREFRYGQNSPLLREVGEKLAEQPNTPANVDRLVRFMRRQLVPKNERFDVPQDLQALLEAIVNRSSDSEVRAWAGFALTQNNSVLRKVSPESLRR